MKKILLHTCCGPCFLGTLEGLKGEDFEITNFYYNPNIQPKDEWELRLKNLRVVAESNSKEVIVPDYDPETHKKAILGRETQFPVRCLDCYRLRLEKTAKHAKDAGYDMFSTTLLVSPYQQHDDLKRIGEELAKKYKTSFYYQNLRPFFREGQKEAKDLGLYRQKYCGCLYSKDQK